LKFDRNSFEIRQKTRRKLDTGNFFYAVINMVDQPD